MIPFNSDIVKCENLAELMHELSNVGARDEFGKLVEELIVPTLVSATQKGEREIRLGNREETSTHREVGKLQYTLIICDHVDLYFFS